MSNHKMSQLLLNSFKAPQLSVADATKDVRPYNNIIVRWKTDYQDYDDYKDCIIDVHVEFSVQEALVKIKGKEIPGYKVIVSCDYKSEGYDIDNFIAYEAKYTKCDFKKAVRDYSDEIALVLFQWKVIGENRVRVFTKNCKNLFLCPFCGNADDKFFEACIGCGKRFLYYNPDADMINQGG